MTYSYSKKIDMDHVEWIENGKMHLGALGLYHTILKIYQPDENFCVKDLLKFTSSLYDETSFHLNELSHLGLVTQSNKNNAT